MSAAPPVDKTVRQLLYRFFFLHILSRLILLELYSTFIVLFSGYSIVQHHPRPQDLLFEYSGSEKPKGKGGKILPFWNVIFSVWLPSLFTFNPKLLFN